MTVRSSRDTRIAAGVIEAAAVAALHVLACAVRAGCEGAGALRAGALAGKAESVAAVRSMHNVLGGTIDPHAAYLMLRGMKTLDVRVQRQNQVGRLLLSESVCVTGAAEDALTVSAGCLL